MKQRFGKMIPFVVPRGSLSNEKQVNEYKNIIIESLELLRKKSFENECGHSIKELIEFGFSEDEIKQFQAKFHWQTGEELDRREIVENAIKNKKKELTLQENEKKSFENECGHSIEELIELGFTENEIDQFQAKFHWKTGEKLNRRKIVENAIKSKGKKLTLQEIGKETIATYKSDTGEAIKVIDELEQQVNIADKANDEIIQGEN